MRKGMRLWHAEASDKKNDDSYRRNLNIWVFAETFDDAYRKVRREYPTATIWKIIGDRYANDVLVAD